METMRVIVDVGWTSERPLRPEQHVSQVVVSVPLPGLSRSDLWDAENEARLVAAQIVASNGRAVMPTSTEIVRVVL